MSDVGKVSQPCNESRRGENDAPGGDRRSPRSIPSLSARHQPEPFIAPRAVRVLAVFALGPRSRSRQSGRDPARDRSSSSSRHSAVSTTSGSSALCPCPCTCARDGPGPRRRQGAKNAAVRPVSVCCRPTRRRDDIPNPHRLVRPSRNEYRALARPTQALNRHALGVTPEGLDPLTGRERPEEDQTVVAGRGEVPPVGRDFDDLDGGAVADKDADAMTFLDVPQPAGPIRRTGREVQRVGVEREALYPGGI